MKQKRIKKNNPNTYIWSTIILLAIYMYLRLSFLTTFNDWWIVVSFIVVVILIIVILFIKMRALNFIKIAKVSSITFLIIWNIVYLYGKYLTIDNLSFTVCTDLNGYYTSRIDGVLFSYRGYKFDRPLNLTDVITKYGDNLTKECKVELCLKEVFPNFYYINYISIIKK